MEILSRYTELETPALIVDKGILTQNIRDMQEKCDGWGVSLRPHTKTHKSPYIAQMQLDAGAKGVTVAKTGEAEVMAAQGVTDIFIANEIVAGEKLKRILELSREARISFAVDSPEAARAADTVFRGSGVKARVMIEVDTGEKRSGVASPDSMEVLVKELRGLRAVEVLGVFSHEGFTYNALSPEHCLEQFEKAQRETLAYAKMAEGLFNAAPVVSMGATPTALLAETLIPGITELRPGTYALMDAGQGHAVGSYDRCAAFVLTTVTSKPTWERVVCDVGAKGITAQSRASGLCKAVGLGLVRGSEDIRASKVYDEHMIFEGGLLSPYVSVGDIIEIIPNHICPVCNLYDEMYLVDGDNVEVISISCRGMLK